MLLIQIQVANINAEALDFETSHSSEIISTNPNGRSRRSVVHWLRVVEVVPDRLVSRVIRSWECHERSGCAVATFRDSDLTATDVKLRLIGDMHGKVFGSDKIVASWKSCWQFYDQWVHPCQMVREAGWDTSRES